jgi:hypothetical protein
MPGSTRAQLRDVRSSLRTLEPARQLSSMPFEGSVPCGAPKQKRSRTCFECRPKSGQANGAWRGGRVIHKAGYVMRYAPKHPRANANPYVFEHILLVEERLGRYLHPFENVHHRNGVRDDNRPENLELWTRPQPNGIRAREAIEWAHRILRLYRDLPEGL